MFAFLNRPSAIKRIHYSTQAEVISEDNLQTDQIVIQNLSDIGMISLTWEGRRAINTTRLSAYALPQPILQQLENLSGGASESIELIKQIEKYLPADREDFSHKIEYHLTSFQVHMMLVSMAAALVAASLDYYYNAHKFAENLYVLIPVIAAFDTYFVNGKYVPIPETPREEKLAAWRLKQQRELKIQEQASVWKDQPWVKMLAQVTAHGDSEFRSVCGVNLLIFLGGISLNLAPIFEGNQNAIFRLAVCAFVVASLLHIYEISTSPKRFEAIKHRHENVIARIPAEIQQGLMDVYEVKTATWNRRLNNFLTAIGCATAPNAEQQQMENVIVPTR